jgi:hypothetical protein
MELRNRVRYRLSADAVFAWEGIRNSRFLGEGVTRDISLTGAFVFTPTCPPVGSTVQIDVFLTSDRSKGRKAVRIRTKATVIRVDHSATSEGFAVASQYFALQFGSSRRNGFSVASERQRLEGIFGD